MCILKQINTFIIVTLQYSDVKGVQHCVNRMNTTSSHETRPRNAGIDLRCYQEMIRGDQ